MKWFSSVYRVAIIVLACTVFLAGASNAAVIYDNLYSTTKGADPVGNYNGFAFGPLYDSFSTGSSSFTLQAVKVLLSGDSTSSGSVTVALYNDNSTSPGTVLYTIGSISDSSLSSTLTVYDFTLATSQNLSANTRYWIGLKTSDNSTAYWAWSLDQSAVGVAGEYYANSSGVNSNIGGPYQMQLSSNVVPLPGTAWLLGSGFLGLAGWRRFKKS